MASVSIHQRGSDLLLVPEAFDDIRRLPHAIRQELRHDARAGGWRAVPLLLTRIEAALGERARLDFDPRPPLPFTPALDREPRDYQQEALEAWRVNGGRGVVVLPTGAGKTFLALMAIEAVRTSTVVLVPTLDLLSQWRETLVAGLGAPEDYVGVVGGGERELRPLTVMTYESAARRLSMMQSFGLIVADEAHHLPAPAYARIAEASPAPYRLGLSATPERSDGEHALLERLIGPLVFRREPEALAASGAIAAFRERRVLVSLDDDERAAYEDADHVWRGYLDKRGIRISSGEEFERFVLRRSGGDPEAYAALRAHQVARRIAFGARGKLGQVERLLTRHRADRVLIFSEYNAAVEEIARQLCLPVIVHTTPAGERRAILTAFREGRYTKLATGRVLNEGVDVPDASVAIVLSGSGTRREYIQRLGRILRPKEGTATLYEIVTRDTREPAVAKRRRQPATIEQGA